jgi:GNAT superfamily N-acetyltransferase
MHAIAFDTRLGAVVVRPLRNGDAATVDEVLGRLGPESLRLRFGGARLDLDLLARVDATRHVLVAYADGSPVGIAHLALEDDRTVAEVAVAVADAWQRTGIGGELLRLLTDDARTIGVRHIRAMIRLENTASISLARRVTRIVSRRIEGGELHLVAAV